VKKVQIIGGGTLNHIRPHLSLCALTNVTQGWTFDPLDMPTCGPSGGGRDWASWPTNRGGHFGIYVKVI
jgi:hypothetical protein